MNITPLGNRILIKREVIEEVKKGLIIMPDAAKTKQEIAKVIATGEGKVDAHGNLVPISLAVGDSVLVEKYVGTEVAVGDEIFHIINADSVLAKLS